MVQRYVYSSRASSLISPPCYTHVIQLLFDSIFHIYFIFYIIISFLCVVVFFVYRLYIGFFFYHCVIMGIYVFLFQVLCFLGIISEIGIIVCDYIIIDIFMCCLGFYDNIRDSFMEISMMIFIFMCCMGSLALCDNGFIYYH